VWYYAQAVAFQKELEVTNKPKAKGTKAESDVVHWAKKHNFYKATRIALTGSKDTGDVFIWDGIMAQVKDGYTDRKEPTDFQIGQWLEALDKQRRNGNWEIALLVHKRFGNADPDNWRWYVDGQTFMTLMGKGNVDTTGLPQYVQLQGYMIPPLLRSWLAR
jgi:hypothetical protein